MTASLCSTSFWRLVTRLERRNRCDDEAASWSCWVEKRSCRSVTACGWIDELDVRASWRRNGFCDGVIGLRGRGIREADCGVAGARRGGARLGVAGVGMACVEEEETAAREEERCAAKVGWAGGGARARAREVEPASSNGVLAFDSGSVCAQ